MQDFAPRARFLIADPDLELLDSLIGRGAPSQPLALTAATVRECHEKISVPGTQLLAAFISPDFGHPAWFSVARDVHSLHPGIPLFLICNTRPAMTDEEMGELGVHKTLIKPLTYEKLLTELSGLGASAAAAAEGHTATEAEVTFISLRAASILANVALKFDIYVKLGEDHYTRLWSAGDAIDKEQFQRQVHAGVKNYYIKKEDHRSFLKNYDDLVNSLLDNPDTPFSVKVTEIRSAGENAINFLKREGISAENIQYAVDYANTATKAVGTLARAHADLRKLFLDTAVQEHAVATTMLGSLLLFNIGLREGDTMGKLGLALMLHDIALWSQSAAVQNEEPALMDPPELNKFFAHPAESARILSKVRDFPPAFLEAIADHHVRLNGKGFPTKQGLSQPNRIAELIGISGDLAQMIKRNGPDKKMDVLSRMREMAAVSFTQAILEAFEKTFLK